MIAASRSTTRSGWPRSRGAIRRFPVVVNPAVLAELNALLGTPDGRAFLRASVERMKLHQAHIESQLARYGLPRELLAVPLVESGYRNRVAGIGGGLWMFIVPTARRFGLHVSDVRDDRTNVVLETDAAMRMLSVSSVSSAIGRWHCSRTTPAMRTCRSSCVKRAPPTHSR